MFALVLGRLPPVDAPRAGSAEAKDLGSITYNLDSDAPRAGSAEAKKNPIDKTHNGCYDAPRAGSAEAKSIPTEEMADPDAMHPVQAAPRQRPSVVYTSPARARCTPCRQRRGKALLAHHNYCFGAMHPVQAAPRQRLLTLRR